MDAVEFLKERKRLCEVYFEKTECKECPLENMSCWTSDFCADDSCEKVITIVEQWSKEHPRKTRQSVFLEQFPSARIDSQAVIYVCPADAYGDKVCPKNEENVHMPCRDCRRNFWLQEAE